MPAPGPQERAPARTGSRSASQMERSGDGRGIARLELLKALDGLIGGQRLDLDAPLAERLDDGALWLQPLGVPASEDHPVREHDDGGVLLDAVDDDSSRAVALSPRHDRPVARS